MCPRFEDEFTNSKTNNDLLASKSEFGNVPDSEFSGSGKMYLHKSTYNSSLTKKANNNSSEAQSVEVSGSAEAAEVSSVGEAISTATTTTVVSATATASTVAATSAGAFVAASVIAIGTIGVLTGISVATHDYDFTLNSLKVTANSVSYQVTIMDNVMTEYDYEHYFDQFYKDDESDFKEEDIIFPFTIKVSNSNYEASQDLFYFESEGTFDHLSLGETYSIVVSENRFGGEILFKDSFVTYPSSEFKEYSFPVNVDLKEGTFDVYMDFIDEKGLFSDFQLYLYDLDDPLEINYTFELEPISGYQHITSPDVSDLDLTRAWGYKLSYKNDGEIVEFEENTAQFLDMYGRQSRFDSFVFDRTVNYFTNRLDLQLNYIDDLDWYDDFVFTLTSHVDDPTTGGELTKTTVIPLSSTNEQQSIILSDYDEFDYFDTTYTYSLICSYRDETTILEEETTPFVLEDNSGSSSKFNAFIFDKTFNYKEGTMTVQLDYVDGYDFFNDFVLTLHAWYEDSGSSEPLESSFDSEISLIKTTEPQTIPIFEYELNLETSYTYELTCSYRGSPKTLVEEKEKFVFKDNSGAKSEFNSFIFDKTLNYKEGTFDVRLDFIDDFYYYYSFVLHMSESNPEDDAVTGDGLEVETRDFDILLDYTNDTQTIYFGDYEINLQCQYTYSLTCLYRGESQTLVEEDQPFYFTDTSGAITVFNELIFDHTANFLTNSFEVCLDYVDDYGYYSEFVLSLFPEGVNAQYSFYLDPITTAQTCTFNEQEHYNFSFDYDYTYSLTCFDYRVHDNAVLSSSDDTFKFSDTSGAISNFNDFEFDGTYSFPDQTFEVRLDYQDDFGYYQDFVLKLFDEEFPEEPYAEISLEETNTTQTIDMAEYDISAEMWYLYELSCTYKGQPEVLKVSEEAFKFNDPNSISTVYGITFINNEANYVDRSLWVQLDFRDDYEVLSDFYLIFYGKNNAEEDDYFNMTYVVLAKTTEPQQIYIDETDGNYENYLVDFTKYNMAYNLHWYETNSEDGYEYYLFGSSEETYEPISLTNSAKSDFTNVDSNFQIFKEDPYSADSTYSMYVNFDFVDEKNQWSSIEIFWEWVNPENPNATAHQTDIYYMTDRLQPGWQKVTVDCSGDEDDIFNGDDWDLVITAFEDDPFDDKGEEFKEIYRKTTKPTLVEEPDPQIFNIDFSETILNEGEDNFSLTAFALFAGSDSYFVDVQLIFQQNDGTTYTYSISNGQFSDYFNFYINDPDEGSIDPYSFSDVPYDISVRYCTYINGVKSSPITVNLATNRTFGLSV